MSSASRNSSHAVRARRLLALMHHLEPDSVTPVPDLAEALGVSEQELAADLELLSVCAADRYDPLTNVPLYVEDGLVHVFGKMPALDRAVRLTSAEAHALVTALQAVGRGSDDPLVTALIAASSGVDTGEVERVVRTAVSPDAGPYTVLASAAARRERVCIDYQGLGDPEPRARTIEPLAMQSERGAWYVHAFCREAGALRTFRLDRIRTAEPTGAHFTPHRFDATGAILPSENLPRAVIAFAPGVTPPEREWPGSHVIQIDAPGTVVAVPYAGTAWIAREVASFLGDAVVLEPFEVREAVASFVTGETNPCRRIV